MVVVVEILKNTQMRLLCTKLLLQQRLDVHPIVPFFASLPQPKCFIYPKHGLYRWPCPARDMSLNSLFPLMVFPPKLEHSSCINAFYAIFVRLGRSSGIWQNEILGKGQLPYLVCFFKCIKAIGKASLSFFETFQLKHSTQIDWETNKPANQLILIGMRGEHLC